jgi:hypothetical protein
MRLKTPLRALGRGCVHEMPSSGDTVALQDATFPRHASPSLSGARSDRHFAGLPKAGGVR